MGKGEREPTNQALAHGSTQSDKHINIIRRRFAEHPSCPGRVIQHPLREEITDAFSKFPEDLSIITVCEIQGDRRLRSSEQGRKCVLVSMGARSEGGYSSKGLEHTITVSANELYPGI